MSILDTAHRPLDNRVRTTRHPKDPAMSDPSPPAGATRRQFVQTAAATTAAALTLDCAVHAAGSDVIRVGLVGCGARGRGAAVQALTADSQAKLVAVGDAFADQIDGSLKVIEREVAKQVDVPQDRRFVGLDAYKHVIDAVDVVLLTTP